LRRLDEASEGGEHDDGSAWGSDAGESQQQRAHHVLSVETTRLRTLVQRRQGERSRVEQQLRAATAAVGGRAGAAEAAAAVRCVGFGNPPPRKQTQDRSMIES
jgi:hypothetical protein